MVMTILEARVAQENWPALRQAYREASTERDAGLAQSFLVQSVKDRESWQILTVWESREALDAMRRTEATPKGVLIFRSAQAEPGLAVYEIAEEIK